jgi:hypothetical protein
VNFVSLQRYGRLAPTNAEISERRRIFKAALPYFGTVQPASFFQRTAERIRDVERIHNLIEGIYKPDGWIYPLSIASMLKSRYSDQLFHNPDRTWWMEYSPKAGGMGLAVNAGLTQCLTDRQPVLVLRQESDKTSAAGSRHLLLGRCISLYCVGELRSHVRRAGQKFHSPRHVEADGAHIIGKDVRGTDDPRNGIALSKSAHWAFDRGIFTISDQYEIVVNPKVSSASVAHFPAIELDRRPICCRMIRITVPTRTRSNGTRKKSSTVLHLNSRSPVSFLSEIPGGLDLSSGISGSR